MTKKPLTKEQIFKSNDLKIEVVDVPEWGGQIRLKGLSGIKRAEIEKYQASKGGDPDPASLRARMLIFSIVDEKDKQVFELSDGQTLMEKSAAVTEWLFEKAMKLSGIGGYNIEKIAKNSETDTKGGSSSDSASKADDGGTPTKSTKS